MQVSIRHTLGPFLLLLLCPPFVMLMWFVNDKLGGSMQALWQLFMSQGFISTIYSIWHPYFWGSKTAWLILSVFIVFELALVRLLPGKTVYGPLTPSGYTPVYKDNGLLAFVITMTIFLVASYGLNFFSASMLYDHLGHLLGALNLFSLLVCLLLYFKGRYYPSSSDASRSGNFLFDYYWGIELYPQLFGWHIKQFITCRFGMMSWGLLLISYAAKQTEMTGLSNAMLVSVSLQLIYIAKFYVWESGYLRSLDIMHDRAGFYICWGCLVWVPCIYTSPSMYLVRHPIHLSSLLATGIFMLGVISIMINYLADKQRMLARATNGLCNIWGKHPITVRARYQTEAGQVKESLLLASGWWGVARHFHYVPEIMAAFLWSVPALFNHFTPYFYVSFLTILLVDRACRDDKRCAKKYGLDWKAYCDLVPYKIIPGLI